MSSIELLYQAFLNGSTICTDTRKISSHCIFFALKGENFNGNLFAAEALSKGAAFVVVDEKIDVSGDKIIQVNDVLNCLQQLALHHRKQLNIPFIAITGSNGKTTTKELVKLVLEQQYKIACTVGNLNNHIGVPLTLLSVTNEHQIAIIEMGANHRKEIELLCSLALPTHVLITNVGLAHLEGFGGFEGVKKGKGEMYDFARKNDCTVFMNDNSSDLNSMLGNYSNVFRYGSGKNCNVIGEPVGDQRHVQVKWKKNNALEHIVTQSKITGIYNFENILAAISIGVYFNVPLVDINDAIESYIPANQRSQEIKFGDSIILMDAYNANPTSMEVALKNFKTHQKGRQAVFIGEMLELGESSPSEHMKILELVKKYEFDIAIFVGKNFKLQNTDYNFTIFENSEDAALWTKKQNLEGYNILIKGSRGSKMEKLLEAIVPTGQ